MTAIVQRIRTFRLTTTWLVLGGVGLFVLIIAVLVARLPAPSDGYGGLNAEIIGDSLGEMLPSLLAIVIGSLLLEAIIYLFLTRVLRTRFALPYALLAPAAVGLAVFVVYPFLFNIRLAFSDAKQNTLACYSANERIQQACTMPRDEQGNPILFSWEYGVENFQRVFFRRNEETGQLQWGALLRSPNSTFPVLFGRTIVWTVVNVFFHVTGGMILALLLNREMALRGLYRTLLVIPWAIPQVIVALAWRGEFHSQWGFVNVLLGRIAEWGVGSFHLGDLCIGRVCVGPQPWLRDQPYAFIAAMIVNIWLGIPFMMVIILGGLQSIPPDFYEAAQMDGASPWQQFWGITMPMLRPILTPAVTLGAIWTFNQFNVIWLVTEGGPQERSEILVTALFHAAKDFSQYGYGAAFSIVIFLILFVFAVGWIRLSGGLRGVYE